MEKNILLEHIPFEDYRSAEGLNSSLIPHIIRSPAHALYYMEHTRPATTAQTLGTAIHAAILEPERFNAAYMRGPSCGKTFKADKQLWQEAEIQALQQQKIILPAKEHDLAVSLREEVLQNQKLKTILESQTVTEGSIFWADEVTAVKCKARPDLVSKDLEICVDIKSTSDASPRGFAESIKRYGYARQAAFYIRGLKQAGINIKSHVIIAVEKVPPYCVASYVLSEDAYTAATNEIDSALLIWKEALETKQFKKYSTDIQRIDFNI